MLFNSGQFLFFFIGVYLLYTRLGHRGQNTLLLIASYIFYGAWDVRFLILIFISTVVDYTAGILIHERRQAGRIDSAKRWMILSVVVNLGILGFFKYFNFFADNLVALAQVFGWYISPTTLNIILPAGISFYTFQTMSYSLDIFRGKMKPTRQFFDFALFVAFFPQLMAGPIERAKRLLPQIESPRTIQREQVMEGTWLFFWGVFKKVFIADNLAPYSFWSSAMGMSPTAADIYLGSLAFILQFYCDFSGYSDMARGLASVMGFKLSLNFNLPYFSTNPSVFWSRWHITLSSWLRDYVYAPIVKGKYLNGNKTMALLLTMGISGFWHGADWKFILWGALWGATIYVYRKMIPTIAILRAKGDVWRIFLGIGGAIITLNLWIFLSPLFTSPTLGDGLSNMWIIISDGSTSNYTSKDALTVLYYLWPLVLMQIAQFYTKDHLIIFKVPYPIRIVIYSGLALLLMTSGAEGGAEFLYFQF